MVASEVEIIEIPPLSPGQSSLMDMHSVLNVLNVLHGELTVVGMELADDPGFLHEGLSLCLRMRDDLVDPDAALRHVATLPETIAAIRGEITQALERRSDKGTDKEVQESLANIESVFKVFEVRAREILARSRAAHDWVQMPVKELHADFRTVFAAFEKNSRGRYRIIYNLAQQETSDYYIDFMVESEGEGTTVSMPLVFKDVMRDLVANARKYTNPGGSIHVGLFENAKCLKFSVQDSGRGIPPDELQKVVHYGHRGSNVGEVRTMGGGFGLTKAFFVTKQFGGRFWIRSELGIGTRIRIELPRPQ